VIGSIRKITCAPTTMRSSGTLISEFLYRCYQSDVPLAHLLTTLNKVFVQNGLSVQKKSSMYQID
jgi:hypothetical protein